MATLTLLAAAFARGGRTRRFGNLAVIHLEGCSFASTAMECTAAENWARGKLSRGSPHGDRMAFVERFTTLIARSGSGVASRGGRQALQGIVKDLKDSGMQMSEWSVPHNLYESMEIKRKPAVAAVAVGLQAPDALDPALSLSPPALGTSS